MKKLFRTQRVPWGGEVITREVTPGCQWALEEGCTVVEKIDGELCAIINDKFYRKMRTKRAGSMRPGSIRIKDADEIDGTLSYWIPVSSAYPEDKWFMAAYLNTPWANKNEEYVAVGPHFRGNPYGLDEDFLDSPYRIRIREPLRTFDDIAEWLSTHEAKGIVFINHLGEKCCVERKDFGLQWPVPEVE